MRFLFDNSLAPKLARGLNVFASPSHAVIHLRDRFSATMEDAQWMRQLVDEEDWVIVTADARISKNPHEIRAWKEAGHTIFFLKPGWAALTFWIQAARFAKCFPDVIATAAKSERGSSFTVSVNGKIQ